MVMPAPPNPAGPSLSDRVVEGEAVEVIEEKGSILLNMLDMNHLATEVFIVIMIPNIINSNLREHQYSHITCFLP